MRRANMSGQPTNNLSTKRSNFYWIKRKRIWFKTQRTQMRSLSCLLAAAQQIREVSECLCVKRCYKLYPWSHILPRVLVAHGSNQYSGVQVRWKRCPKVVLFGRAETNEHCRVCLLTRYSSSLFWVLRCRSVGRWVGGWMRWVEVPRAWRKCRPYVRPSSDAPDLAAGCSIWRLAHSHVTCRWRGSRRDHRK